MVAAGEVDALVPERVWQELARGLMERQPSRLFEVLHGCGALARLLPELNRVWNDRLGRRIDEAASNDEPLDVRWALLTIDLTSTEDNSDAEAMAQRLRVPAELRAMAQLIARERGSIERASDLSANAMLETIERCDGIRRPDRFLRMLKACSYVQATTHPSMHFSTNPSASGDQTLQAERFVQALNAARGVDAGAVAQSVPADQESSGGTPSARTSPDTTVSERIRLAVQRARIDAITRSAAV
jgi:tRNA nucleotidyltransferase (CCA-adding enzyme)